MQNEFGRLAPDELSHGSERHVNGKNLIVAQDFEEVFRLFLSFPTFCLRLHRVN